MTKLLPYMYVFPSALVSGLESWQQIFRRSWFAPPGADHALYNTALFIGVLLSFVIVAVWVHRGIRFIGVVAGLAACVVALSGCLVLRHYLREPWDPVITSWLEWSWSLCAMAAMVSISATVTLAAMLIGAGVRQSQTPG
ncbi:MAG: hypothetical protein EOR30_16845 [Mesorhizobium sp.]|uniref:hypothetical protein n=1 Tax=unclassified Mesorhizobium TaxID=325217 RepID=UPI000FCC7895|nr:MULTISPECIES: hypothetical protein [unclassified Mesorhizobium]RUV75963.1 hypothetical protein EOA78_05010 [Mesorhizobium sp. M5C.F.Cr.IN.023.01.1.1]RWF85752.1 MAG: hypothetical protein EOQ36_20805 [Mesorhizobium sp.]RWF95248.1 MAG: hypothetical protein EOQ45_07905 [Mesorhizobium sp.]RWI39918.1 MAG: hypothetical protein EOR14_17740 [Mesorhizobium sp.]RWI45218.1 MAG: hypothetical protein EOR15_22300 [Mesorhizobium sp.]